MNKIVVGVDGSEHAGAALAWAVAEARLRDAELCAVHVWSYPYMADVAYLSTSVLDRGELEGAAKEVLATALADVPSDVRVTEVVREGSASEALLAAAKDADLLVVGSRGRGGFAGLLLGSVSHQCAHHATCPVVIVPLR